MTRLAICTLALAALAGASPSGLQDLAAYPKYEVQFLADRPIKLSDAQRCERYGLASDDDWLDLRPRAGNEKRDKERGRIEGSSSTETPTTSTEVTRDDLEKGYQVQARETGELAGSQTSPKLIRMHFTHEEYDAPHAYMCALPSKNTTDAQQAAARAKQDEPEPDPNKSWQALDYLEDRCLYATHGWFTYAYCHNQYVRQFHQAPGGKPGPNGFEPKEDTNYEAYNLGFSKGKYHEYEEAAMPDTTFGIGPWSRYLVQRWTAGTKCAETGKPREVEVQMHCSLSTGDSIFMIKEVSLCQYVLVIYTPSLCSLPGFRPQSALDVEPAGIKCRELMEDDEFEQWNTERIERERLEHEGKLLEAAKIEEEKKAKEDAESRIRDNEEAEKDGETVKKEDSDSDSEGKKSSKKSKKGKKGSHIITEDDLAAFTISGGEMDEATKKLILDAVRKAFGAGGEGDDIEISFLGLHDDDDVMGGRGGLGLPVISLEDLAGGKEKDSKEAQDSKNPKDAEKKRKDDRHRPTVQFRNREGGNLGVREEKKPKHDRAGTKADTAEEGGKPPKDGAKERGDAEPTALRDEL